MPYPATGTKPVRCPAFVRPVAVLRSATDSERCATRPERHVATRGGTARRPRRSAVRHGKHCHPEALPPDFVQQLSQLLRGRQFVCRLAELLGQGYVRFGDILFERESVSESAPDGVPAAMYSYRNSSGYELVDVPPGLVQCAAGRCGLSEDFVSQRRLCAVFERYGVDEYTLHDADESARIRCEDISTQLRSWCDYGESFRTETDIMSSSGAEMFYESRTDLLE